MGSIEVDTLAFIEQLKERLIGGRIKIFSEDDTEVLLDVYLNPEWVDPNAVPGQIWFITSKLHSARKYGKAGLSTVYDRYGLVMPFTIDLSLGTSYITADIRFTSPLKFDWGVLLRYARYCDEWNRSMGG